MLAGIIRELTVVCSLAFIGAYLGMFKRREAKLYGLDLLWVSVLTIAASLVPYIILQAVVGFSATQICGTVPRGAFQGQFLLALVVSTFIARRLVEWRVAARRKEKSTA